MEEYNHISDGQVLESRDHYDKCKCDLCQERVKFMDKIIDYRKSSKNMQKVNKGQECF